MKWRALAGRLGGAALALASAGAAPAETPPPTLLMLGFELIDETRPGQTSPPAPEQRRLQRIEQQLRRAFTAHRFYVVLDPGPVAAAIARARADLQYLYDCNGCELDIARAADAERVLTGWVQKVSELILNINFEIKEVDGGRTVLRKSVDIRGNSDATWARGIAFLVRDMREKGQGGR